MKVMPGGWSDVRAVRPARKVRAYAIWSLVDVLRMKFGATGLYEVRASLPAGRREQLRSLPGQSAWFGLGLYYEVLRGAVDRFYAGDPRGAFELSRAAKQLDVKRVFEPTGKYATPVLLMRRLNQIRGHYVDGGEFETEVVDRGVMRCTFRGLELPSSLVAHDIAGGLAGWFDMSSGREVALLDMEIAAASCTSWIRFDAREERVLLADHGVM